MSACPSCSATLAPSALTCAKCNAWNLSAGAGMGGLGEIGAGDLVDALDVDASTIEHIPTGPWDGVFGGGVVRGATY